MKAVTWSPHVFPRIRRAGRYSHPKQENDFPYLDPSHALHLVEYDAVYSTKDLKDSYKVSPGDLTLTPAGVTTFCSLHEASHHICIHFFPCEEKATLRLPQKITLGEERASVQQRLWRIIDTHRLGLCLGKKGAVAQAAASAELLSLLLWMHCHPSASGKQLRHTRSTDVARECMKLIENHYAEPFHLEGFARKNGVSPNHLSRVFHQLFGVNILKALIVRRIEEARHLLCNSNLSIKEVGVVIGLPDAQHFNKQFRRVVGLSPSAYRASSQKTTYLMNEKWDANHDYI